MTQAWRSISGGPGTGGHAPSVPLLRPVGIGGGAGVIALPADLLVLLGIKIHAAVLGLLVQPLGETLMRNPFPL